MKKLNPFSLIFIAGAFIVSCSTDTEIVEKETPVSVSVGAPSLEAGDNVSLSGQLESYNTAIISTRMMGFISRITVNPGDKVVKGQLLVAISSDDIQAKRAQAVAMIGEAEAALQDAEKDFNRFKKLYNQESASEKEFENAMLRYNSMKAKAEAAQQMKSEADAMLIYTNLTAPFSGVVTQKHIQEGSMANPGMPILTIEQPKDFQIRVMVSEREVGRLKKGMDADVTVKSTGRKFHATISEISPSAQFTGGRFQLKLAVPSNENPGLLSGMYVNVNITIKSVSGIMRLFVPASAIIYHDQLAGLYTVDHDQKAQLRWLKIGKIQGTRVEILSGLRFDEPFITQSDSRLYSGAPVLINKELTSAQ